MDLTMRSLFAVVLAFAALASAPSKALESPDHHIVVKVAQGPGGELSYAIDRDGVTVVLPSALGLQLFGIDLTRGLTLQAPSAIKPVDEQYDMAVGKKPRIRYRANEQVFTVRATSGQQMQIAFRTSNDGVAFRYRVGGAGRKQFVSEATSFAFDPSSTAWLQPMQVAQTGWMNTNPAYEENYQRDIPVGTPSPSQAGWVFPALFRTGDTWVALSEAAMDGSFHASRLQADSANATYHIGLPMAPEVFTGGALLADTEGELVTPWRLLAIGSLKTVMESTLGTDLAAPAIAFDSSKVQPGHASWSWALLKDDATVYEVQKQFIDYAADMRWNYTLVDADWDRKIGYERLRELVQYAAAKHVGVLVWYNSSGLWNKTQYSPKGALLEPVQRRAEFARLKAMGIKGVKVDFFAGDGVSMIAFYVAILKDAAEAGLLVNFHGATLPRGWSRTYPNLMSVEAVKGLEFTTFSQADEDAVVRHAAVLPFARNLFDPMDFTPMVFGDIPAIHRATRNGFELAESVLFLSGIQHFAETPAGMATVPDYVKSFLQTLPRRWDEVRFVAGYPGTHVVIARKAGKAWYIAGINADDQEKTLTLDLGFLGKRSGVVIADGATERAFERRVIKGEKTDITIKPHGGFVAVFK
jgi:alpha-glucosidase